jgi:multicomponent Na+:H+ antiporter subunit D
MQTIATAAADWVIILPVILPLAGAALLMVLRGGLAPVRKWLTVLVVLAVGAADALLLARVMASGPLAMTMGRWLPPFGISFAADALGAGFALVAAVVTLVVVAYGDPDENSADRRAAYAAMQLFLLAGVDGAFLTGDVFNLYVWFELMLIASFGLIAFSGRPLALDGAVKYGIVSFVGTSLFLAALGLLYGAFGTLNMADLAGLSTGGRPGVLATITALLLVAFGTKAAVFPVQGWLPASYHTPAPAVSALVGGLLTKVGVYALLRTLLMLLPTGFALLQPLVAVLAAATLVLAPLGALNETNLRRAIGFWLIGGVGAAVAGIALGAPGGAAGAASYAVHAMLTVGALYLVAGLIEREAALPAGADGRPRRSVWLAMAFFALMLAIAGVPPFLGFWPKLVLLSAAAQPGDGAVHWGLAACLLLNAFLTLLGGARLWARLFWRGEREPAPAPSATPAAEAPAPGAEAKPLARDRVAFAATAVLTLGVIVLGLWPAPLLAWAEAAGAGLAHPQRYIAAVGPEVRP